MTMYSNFLFFYILALVLIPAIIMGLMEKSVKYYGLLLSIIALIILVGGDRVQTACLITFYFGQLILVKGYLAIRRKSSNKWLFRLAICFSLLPLLLVKISPLLTTRTIGFVGISYITFKSIQIIIETYDGIIREVSLFEFTYFLLFFPTIASGPIDRSRRFADNSKNPLNRRQYFEEYLGEGIWKIFKGLAYKFILASFIWNNWLNQIPQSHTVKNVLSYMYGYSFYLFFDFAGYSLIAIGTSYLLGIKAPQNFHLPFISKDMKEFWNRWHMSLSFWFRDYIYNRFLMNSIKKKRFKSKFTASYIGYLITMLTMGIWHGLHWFYVLYGLYEASAIILTDYFQRKSTLYKTYKDTTWWKAASIFITFNIACFGLLIFSGYLYNK